MKDQIVKTWKEIKGIDYPYRLKIEGFDVRKWYIRADHVRYAMPFSDEELGFQTSWERKEMINHLKYAKLDKIEKHNKTKQ
jgi:hypothetical protein